MADRVLIAGGDKGLVSGIGAGEVGLTGNKAVLEDVEWMVHLDQGEEGSIPSTGWDIKTLKYIQYRVASLHLLSS